MISKNDIVIKDQHQVSFAQNNIMVLGTHIAQKYTVI